MSLAFRLRIWSHRMIHHLLSVSSKISLFACGSFKFYFAVLPGHTVMSLSTPSMYSVYPGGFGYPTPASPTSGGCPTPSFGFHHSMALPVTNGCFPPGFPSRPPQPFGAPHNAMAGGGGGGAPFLRNALSTKNLQAFNAYQTHLYPDVYPEYRQGWLISPILSLSLVGFSLNTRCVMECQIVPPSRNLFNDFRFSFVQSCRSKLEIEQWSFEPDVPFGINQPVRFQPVRTARWHASGFCRQVQSFRIIIQF